MRPTCCLSILYFESQTYPQTIICHKERNPFHHSFESSVNPKHRPQTITTPVWVRSFPFPVSVFHCFLRWRRMRIAMMSDAAFPGVLRRTARSLRGERWMGFWFGVANYHASSLNFKAYELFMGVQLWSRQIHMSCRLLPVVSVLPKSLPSSWSREYMYVFSCSFCFPAQKHFVIVVVCNEALS